MFKLQAIQNKKKKLQITDIDKRKKSLKDNDKILKKI